MSTRCEISALIGGKVHTIYCRHDGYPERIIPSLKNYSNQEIVEKLIFFGDRTALNGNLQDDEKDAYAYQGKEPFEYNKPEITEEFVISSDIFIEFQYYWDGEKWFWTNKEKPLSPISATIWYDSSIENDKKALEAIAYLRNAGYTVEQVKAAMEGNNAVKTT